MKLLRWGSVAVGLMLLTSCYSAPGWRSAAEDSRAAAPSAAMRHAALDDYGITASGAADFRGLGESSLGLDNLGSTAGPSAGLYFQDEAGRPRSQSPREEGAAEPAIERRLIHSGRIDLAVGDTEAAARQAKKLVESMGGYVQALNDAGVTLRIPADRWEEAIEQVATLGRVIGRDLQVQDVTEEFLDVELQLKNHRELSARLSELLARAETVEAALKVEKELGRVRNEIERLEGRLKLLRNRISFATLTVRLVQVSEAQVNTSRLPFAWLQNLGVERLLGLPGVGR